MSEKNSLSNLNSLSDAQKSSAIGGKIPDSDLNPMIMISKIGNLFKRADGQQAKDDSPSESRLLVNSFYNSKIAKLMFVVHMRKKKRFC